MSPLASRLGCTLAAIMIVFPAAAQITAEAIETATYDGGALPEDRAALTAKLQILLDRHGVSPGVIDGVHGDNVDKAVMAFEAMFDLPVDGRIDPDVWAILPLSKGAPLTMQYTVVEADVADIVAPLPEDYSELARLERLGFTSVAEKLAERFHMDIDLLHELNPGMDAETVGATLWVVDPGEPMGGEVGRIVADKSNQQLLAYDASGGILAAYPVTIGSDATPSPSGIHEVAAIAIDPTYTYQPENFTQGDNREPLILPAGPNGPVGSVWIDLSAPTYGIHGSPEPATIDKTQSHGCVRLTNWDAQELAHMVAIGTVVEFRE